MMLAGMLSCATAHGWGSDDMEIFDLVEEVNENFYTLMQINQVRNVGGSKRRFDSEFNKVFWVSECDESGDQASFSNHVGVVTSGQERCRGCEYQVSEHGGGV